MYHNWANLTFYYSLEHYGNQFLEGFVIGMVFRNNFQMFIQFAYSGNGEVGFFSLQICINVWVRESFNLSEELQHPKCPIADKEDGEWTDEDEMPPLIDASDEESRGNELPPDPWNDDAFALQEYGLTRENLQKFNHQNQVDRIHRCITDIRMKLNIITSSQEDMRTSMNKRDEVLLKIIQTNRLVTEVNHSVETVMESQDSIKNILKDLYDIINCMNKYDKTDSQDFVKKMDKISRRMQQCRLECRIWGELAHYTNIIVMSLISKQLITSLGLGVKCT